jgi:hypothetical protein
VASGWPARRSRTSILRTPMKSSASTGGRVPMTPWQRLPLPGMLRTPGHDPVSSSVMADARRSGAVGSRRGQDVRPAEATRGAQIFDFFAGECLRVSGESASSVSPGIRAGRRGCHHYPMELPDRNCSLENCAGARLRQHCSSRPRDTPGFYLQPALFAETTPHMRINREVIKVKDYDKALAVANDTPLGLSSGYAPPA